MSQRLPRILCALTVLVAAGAAFGAQKVPEYTVVVLDPLSTELGELGNVNALHINDQGQAIGQANGQIPGRIAGAAIRYTPGVGLENLDPFGNFNSASWRLNGSGLVYGSDFGNRGQTAIYVYNGSAFEYIAEDQSEQFQKSFYANAMNDSGEIVGVTGVWNPGPAHAYRYSADAGWQEFSSVDNRLWQNASGELINNRGDIVFTHEPDYTQRQALLLTAEGELFELGDLGGGYTTPMAMNESGQVVGAAVNKLGRERGFLFTPGGGLIEIHRDGFRISRARHVTPEGVVAGVLKKKQQSRTVDTLFIRQPAGTPRVVVRRSRFKRLAARSGFSLKGMDVQAINDRLEFVGSVFENGDAGFVSVPYLYSPGEGLVSLKDVVDAAGVGMTATEAWDINNLGQILVSVTDGNRRSTAILTPVE
jgi:hypothetical protein